MRRARSVLLRPQWVVFLILRWVVFLTRGSAVFLRTLASAVLLRTWAMVVLFHTLGGVGLLHTLAAVGRPVSLGMRAVLVAVAATLDGMAMAIMDAIGTGEVMQIMVTAATATAAPIRMAAATTSTADTGGFWFATTTEVDSLTAHPGCPLRRGAFGNTDPTGVAARRRVCHRDLMRGTVARLTFGLYSQYYTICLRRFSGGPAPNAERGNPDPCGCRA